jgi:DNA-binding CsgD family transcriptional regulator
MTPEAGSRWCDDHRGLQATARRRELSGEELGRLAALSCLLGHVDEGIAAWENAHRIHLAAGDVPAAVRCGFWISFSLFNEGLGPRASGWVDRGQRLLDDLAGDCVEHGYVQHQVGLRCALRGDPAGGQAAFGRAAKLAKRFADEQLAALAMIGEGRCLIYLGELAEGLALLDEAMVAVSTGPMAPVAVGDAYCTVIEASHELFDVDRARLWTEELTRWCDAHTDATLYRRQCFVHRAELMLLDGSWDDAESELRAACEQSELPGTVVAGLAWYLRGQLDRLRGRHEDAAECYGRANQHGRPPQPGAAMLCLARGDTGAAYRMIATALAEGEDPLTRAALLGPAVEIALAHGDVDLAAERAEELAAISAELGSAYLRAVADSSSGAVSEAAGQLPSARPRLRRAWKAWHDLGAPYEAARIRVRLGRLCAASGDADTAALEFAAARRSFERLGAADDLAGLDRLTPGAVAGDLTTPLSGREREVLALVAQGLSNRAIAAKLVVSEKTVASHVSHIFTKLGVPNRAAATAYAYEHGLVSQ